MNTRSFLLSCLALGLLGCDDSPKSPKNARDSESIRLQLNWFHDPSFSGEYRAAQQLDGRVQIQEGGVNVSSLQRLKAGLADIAVSGIDIALAAIEADLAKDGTSALRVVFVDFQRNPVGWVLHPDVAVSLGGALNTLSGRERNTWLFEQLRAKRIKVGDKLGTETSAVWSSWRHERGLTGITVTQVGFDPGVVLAAPLLAYPVYLNEEPFKLSERIGKDVDVFDPADDNVVLYGNVLVTTDSVLKNRSELLYDFLDAVADGWRWTQASPDTAALLVGQYYTGVSDSVLVAQIRRSGDFAFYGGAAVGEIDNLPGGRLDQTIAALIASGALMGTSTLERFKPYFSPYRYGAR